MDSGRHDLQKDVGRTHVPPEGGSADFHVLSASLMDGTSGAQSRRAPSLKLEVSRDQEGSWNTLRPGSGQVPDQDRAAQAEHEGEAAGYRARMLAKVGGDQSRAIAFTDAELAGFINHAKRLGFGQADIEAILTVKVRKPETKAIVLKSVADCLAGKRGDKRIRFKEGWYFMKAYREAQEAMLSGKVLKPEVYLDAGYIESHRQAFSGTASYLLPGDLHKKYVIDEKCLHPELGYLGALYVSTKDEIDRVLLEAKGDISVVERLLGFEPGWWQNRGGLWRVDIDTPETKGLRIPDGAEASANPFWAPGAFTSGGTLEAVLDQVPKAEGAFKSEQVIF